MHLLDLLYHSTVDRDGILTNAMLSAVHTVNYLSYAKALLYIAIAS